MRPAGVSLVNMVRSIRCRGCQGDRPLASLQPGKPEDAVGVPPVDDPYPPTSREGGVRPFGSVGPGGRGPRARRVRCSARCGPARRVVQQPKARKAVGRRGVDPAPQFPHDLLCPFILTNLILIDAYFRYHLLGLLSQRPPFWYSFAALVSSSEAMFTTGSS